MNFSRTFWGYEPQAVIRMLADLDRHYEMKEAALAAQIWDLCQLTALLKSAVERLGGSLDAGGPEDPAPLLSAERPADGLPGGERFPALILPRRFRGLHPAEVERERNRRIEMWEQELSERQRELAEADRERIVLFRRLTELTQAAVRADEAVPAPPLAYRAAGEPEAVSPAAPHPAVPPGEPLSFPTRTGGDSPRARPRRIGRAHRQPWRPGSIGETNESSPRERRRGGPAIPRGAKALQLVRTEGQAAAALSSSLPRAERRVASPEPVPVPAREVDPLDQMQAGLSERIELLYQSFLVGKIVGADLVDPGGNLLAAKGSPIVRDLVSRASKAGLLSVLVAQMTIPGVEVE